MAPRGSGGSRTPVTATPPPREGEVAPHPHEQVLNPRSGGQGAQVEPVADELGEPGEHRVLQFGAQRVERVRADGGERVPDRLPGLGAVGEPEHGEVGVG